MARMSDRGQMLLIGAITIAILFVSLAVVLNSSLHAPAQAAQGSEVVSGGQAVTLHENVRADVGELINRSIEAKDTRGEQETYVRNNVTELTHNYARYYADDDRIVQLEYAPILGEHAKGTYSGEGDTTVFTDAYVRNLTVTPSVLSWGPSVVAIGDSSNPWEIEFDGGQITVTDPDGTSETCTPSFGLTNTRVNITEATLHDTTSSAVEDCNALDVFEQLDQPYDLSFENPSAAADPTNRLDFHVISTASISHGTSTEVLYGAEITIDERTPDLDYRRTIRVAPGEPR